MTPDLDRLEAAQKTWCAARRIGISESYGAMIAYSSELRELAPALIEELRTARTRLAALEQPGVTEAFLFGIINTTTGWRNEGFKSAADALWHVGEICRLQRAALAPAPIAQGGETADDVRKRVEGALQEASRCIAVGLPVSIIEFVRVALQPPAGAA